MIIVILVIVLLIVIISSIHKSSKRKDRELQIMEAEYRMKIARENKDLDNPLTQ